MSLVSLFTLPRLVKLWVLGVVLFVIRSTAAKFGLSGRNEVMLYMSVGLAAWMINAFLETIFGSSAIEMNREESDLVKQYLRNRREGETLGAFLARTEVEEESDLDDFSHSVSNSKQLPRKIQERPPKRQQRKAGKV